MKPVDVKSNTYIESSKEINGKDLKFKIGNIARISKHKNVFTKRYVPNWSEEVFVITKVKTLLLGHMPLVILKAKKLLDRFTKNNCKKQFKKCLGLKK